jgi:hypothetical protein
MKIPIKISSNLLGMSEAIQKAVSGLGKNSFHKSTQNVMYQVLEQVMIQYDATARTKDSGVLYGRIPLRTSVNRLANIKHDNDKIIFGILPYKTPESFVLAVASYWIITCSNT